MTPCQYSMYSTEQCPKALAWMAALCAATGRSCDAQQWLIELIGTIVFVKTTMPSGHGSADSLLRDAA